MFKFPSENRVPSSCTSPVEKLFQEGHAQYAILTDDEWNACHSSMLHELVRRPDQKYTIRARHVGRGKTLSHTVSLFSNPTSARSRYLEAVHRDRVVGRSEETLCRNSA